SGRRPPAVSAMPADAFLGLDPLIAMEQQERVYAQTDDLDLALGAPRQQTPQRDYARIDMESLSLPELVGPRVMPEPAPAVVPEQLPLAFWERFGEALCIDLDGMDEAAREALAIDAARLLRQSVSSLQQSLRTRSELKNELRLALTTVQSAGNNPLKHSVDSAEALNA